MTSRTPHDPHSSHDGPNAGPGGALTARADRALVRAGARSTRYALVSVRAPRAPRRVERIPVNLALVLDRSGSMAGGKFDLARRAAEQALARLLPEDRFSLVVYDSEVDVLVPATAATPEARRTALERLARVGPRGSTDLAGGWMRGCEQVALALEGAEPAEPVVSRCLLLTDGLANHGLTDRDTLVRHAAELRERGVQTSTFGVGADFDERLLAGMADAGGGNFYFLASDDQIPALIASEVGEALEVVMRHAALEVRLAPGMTAEPLTRFRSRTVEGEEGGAVLRVELGDLVSGQTLDAVVLLRFPRGTEEERAEVEVGLVGADGLPATPAAALAFTYAGHAANDRQPRDRAVDRQVAGIYAARAREEALEHNRAGNFERARDVLTATARRIREYAGGDAVLNEIADDLLQRVETFAAAPMPAMAMKVEFARSRHVARSRAESGQARRAP